MVVVSIYEKSVLIENNSLIGLSVYREVHLGIAVTHILTATDFHFLEGLN
jgi:hypothetical protein|tara:strand:- start:2115 stop:2264 length:150 start_codon:yes stop_codon:yes gene_type:complete